uniref:BTB domain-containing protein n=1 Tax=Setaria digitata TaxID=48799 RepID=A0A915PEG7_9BILA
MSVVGFPILLERNNSDQDHTYCSITNGYSVPLAQRLSQFRSESIGCDVEFVVGMEQKIIKAHKLVLGCGSEVFATMFYGKMIQERQENGLTTVVVPDITSDAFINLVNFLYSDLDMYAVKLDNDVVMQTLYAAKKYDVKNLILTCIQYLTNCLTASNALCLLSQARFFDEPFLINHCLQMIDASTDEALGSPGVQDIDRDTLAAVVERSELDPTNELVIFKAVQSWSEAECKRREIEVSPVNQRQVLGPVLSLIRFPLMTVHEFGEAATSSLLTCEEITQVFLHLTVVPRPPVSYPTDLRCSGRSRHVVKRFPVLSVNYYNKRDEKFCFMVDREILVSGFGIFGFARKPNVSTTDSSAALDWQTEVEIQISPSPDVPDSSLTTDCASATECVVIQGTVGNMKPVVASFRKPVPVQPNIFYVAGMKFLKNDSVQTYCGKEGAETVTVPLLFDEEVCFRFRNIRNSYDISCSSRYLSHHQEDVCRFEGQIPEIHFLVQWTGDNH